MVLFLIHQDCLLAELAQGVGEDQHVLSASSSSYLIALSLAICIRVPCAVQDPNELRFALEQWTSQSTRCLLRASRVPVRHCALKPKPIWHKVLAQKREGWTFLLETEMTTLPELFVTTVSRIAPVEGAILVTVVLPFTAGGQRGSRAFCGGLLSSCRCSPPRSKRFIVDDDLVVWDLGISGTTLRLHGSAPQVEKTLVQKVFDASVPGDRHGMHICMNCLSL